MSCDNMLGRQAADSSALLALRHSCCNVSIIQITVSLICCVGSHLKLKRTPLPAGLLLQWQQRLSDSPSNLCCRRPHGTQG